MNLVSNIVGAIGADSLSKLTNPIKYNPNDSTFDDLLQKQVDTKIQPESTDLLGNLGMPAGFAIESADGSEMIQHDVGISEKVNNTQSSESFSNPDDEITTSETVTFFTSLLDNKSNLGHSDVLEFAKRQASSLYNKYSRSVITDVNEFVKDIQDIKEVKDLTD